MHFVDLTLPIPARQLQRNTWRGRSRPVTTIRTRTWPIRQGPWRYRARVHDFHFWSMSGTYLDFPGHIRETDDGAGADRWPLARLYRVEAAVLRLDRADGSGGISAAALQAAGPAPVRGGALLINALGRRRFDAVEPQSVYLLADAADWIARRGIRLLVSDVYESRMDPQNVFYRLFARGVAAVCQPIRLHRVQAPRVRLTVLPLILPGATQLPCRVVAEWD